MLVEEGHVVVYTLQDASSCMAGLEKPKSIVTDKALALVHPRIELHHIVQYHEDATTQLINVNLDTNGSGFTSGLVPWCTKNRVWSSSDVKIKIMPTALLKFRSCRIRRALF